MIEQYRQGDIFVEKSDIIISDEFETNEKADDRIILAYGEATGHAHAIKNDNVIFYKHKKEKKLYLVVNNDCKIEHEEHGEIPLKNNIYEVIRQREYTPQEIRYVVD